MPARRRVIKIYNTKANDANYGTLGDVSTSNLANFPRYSRTDRESAQRYPIVPREKTLVGNQAPCATVTTNRQVFETDWSNGVNQKITVPKPIIQTGELKVDRAASFSKTTDYQTNFDQEKYRKFERAIAIKPKQGEHTKQLMESGLAPLRPYKYHKPCVDVSTSEVVATQGGARTKRPSGLAGNLLSKSSSFNTVMHRGSSPQLDTQTLESIRSKLKQRNIGPINAHKLLRPGSKMALKTMNQSTFPNSEDKTSKIDRPAPIVPKENYALKYDGEMQGQTASQANFVRPASSCYAYEDFYVYC